MKLLFSLLTVIALKPFCSGDEDQAQERVHKLAKILKDKDVGSSLRGKGVAVISCIIQRDEGRAPMRHSFHWSSDRLYYGEEPLLRHLEPPLSTFLELVCNVPFYLFIFIFYIFFSR